MRFAGNQLSGTVPSQLTAAFPANSSTWASTCMVNVTASNAGCDLAERAALVDLFSSTGGLHWLISSKWLTTAHPCQWVGVECLSGSSAAGPVVCVLCISRCSMSRYCVAVELVSTSHGA